MSTEMKTNGETEVPAILLAKRVSNVEDRKSRHSCVSLIKRNGYRWVEVCHLTSCFSVEFVYVCGLTTIFLG